MEKFLFINSTHVDLWCIECVFYLTSQLVSLRDLVELKETG